MKHFIVAVIFSISASALKFGEPTYDGSGCPSNSISWILSPNNSSLSLLTGQFSTDATNETRIVHCEIVVPILVNALGKVTADIRGFHDLPTNASHETFITHLPVNGPGTSSTGRYQRSGSDTNNYIHTHRFNISFASQNALKLLLSSILTNPSGSNAASLTIDSIDLTQENESFPPIVPCNSAFTLHFSAVIAAMCSLAILL